MIVLARPLACARGSVRARGAGVATVWQLQPFHREQTMRRRIGVISVMSLLVAACSTSGEDLISSVTAYLNGSLIPGGGNLTRKTFAQQDEDARRAETDRYYSTVRTNSDGTGSSIAQALDTLDKFKTRYQFLGSDCTSGAATCPKAFYYNRGDLGIGREMHCKDNINDSVRQEIACYVVNFSAGDLNPATDGEFRFGLSSNIAFANMNDNRSFATVAMVFRKRVAEPHRVFFVVYGPDGRLANFAALDRHGFEAAKKKAEGTNFGTPGVSFNNHIPSNCVACHGGNTYDSGTHTQARGLFLPFDLDQFDYDNVSGRTRAEQLVAFQRLNEKVRKVAALSGTPAGTSIKNQLDTWYSNTNHTGQTDSTEVFENPFSPTAIPTGWNNGSVATNVYFSVVRPSCRGCHMAQSTSDTPAGLSFDTEAEFKAGVNPIRSANDLCTFQMPHALQTLRLFWQSQQPRILADYFDAIGQPNAATRLRTCNVPGDPNPILDIVTLDPPHIASSVSVLM